MADGQSVIDKRRTQITNSISNVKDGALKCVDNLNTLKNQLDAMSDDEYTATYPFEEDTYKALRDWISANIEASLEKFNGLLSQFNSEDPFPEV